MRQAVEALLTSNSPCTQAGGNAPKNYRSDAIGCGSLKHIRGKRLDQPTLASEDSKRKSVEMSASRRGKKQRTRVGYPRHTRTATYCEPFSSSVVFGHSSRQQRIATTACCAICPSLPCTTQSVCLLADTMRRTNPLSGAYKGEQAGPWMAPDRMARLVAVLPLGRACPRSWQSGDVISCHQPCVCMSYMFVVHMPPKMSNENGRKRPRLRVLDACCQVN